MAVQTQVYGPDGVLRSSLVFSTTSTSRFLTGTLPSDTAIVEVSIRGQPYSADPDLVFFTAGSFIVPNPAAYPSGLELISGPNEVLIRTTNLVGAVSIPASVVINLIASTNDLVGSPPSGLTLERHDDHVTITLTGLSDTRITGYNFYASSFPGGGATGYFRINLNPVVTYTQENVDTEFGTIEARIPALQDTNLRLHAIISQETQTGTALSVAPDVNALVDVPDGTTAVDTTITYSSVTQIKYYSFDHDRTAGATSVPPTIASNQFAAMPLSDYLYYVATAIYFDSTANIEFESPYSIEVLGAPVMIQRGDVLGLPVVTRQTLTQDTILSLYRTRNDLAVQPGAVIRDTFIDPFISEAERLRFILDFVYRASSFETLLQLDDPQNTGSSLAVASAPYKQALGRALFITNDTAIQDVIDRAFEKLASNYGEYREEGRRAEGEAIFYTPRTPTRTLPVPLGSPVSAGSQVFRTLVSASIPYATAASYYDPVLKRYSVRVPVRAVSPGSAGNIGKGQLNTGAPQGLFVTNDADFFGGLDKDTNRQLAAKAMAKLSSVDVGTEQGYLQTVAKTAGVIQVTEVSAGSPLMFRDLDPTTGRHIGGMVDLWIRGLQTSTIIDSFAFTYEKKRDIQFAIVGDPANYRLKAIDSSLSSTNPIAGMLDYPSLGLGLRNASTGEWFDLTGVTFVSYDTIQLDITITQPALSYGDVLLGDYRLLTGDKFVFPQQPVSSITSLTGEVSGTLASSLYSLVHPDSPLEYGRSSRAGDYVQVSGTAIPSGNLITVTNESHIILGFYLEHLDKLGAESLSVVVTDTAGIVTYKGPFDPSGTPDYTIEEGTQTTSLAIKRTAASTITDGQTVLVSYQYNENFSVTYQSNILISTVQNAVNAKRHIQADVLVKEAISSGVDLTATVVLVPGTDKDLADQTIRTDLVTYLAVLQMGASFRRSDAIDIITRSTGISYLVLPLTKMTRSSGSLVLLEDLATDQLGETLRVDDWSNSVTAVWLLTQEFSSPTTTGGGGTSGDFKAVYKDSVVLPLQVANPELLASYPGKAYIIGSQGLSIPGFSDDATLIAQGYITLAEITQRRIEISANRVLVSLAVGDSPANASYSVTYITTDDTGEKDISLGAAEYFIPGTITFTYDEDTSLLQGTR